MFFNEENEDLKAAMITIIKERDGNRGLLKFLDSECVDEHIINHHSGHIETIRLYKTKERYSFLQDRNGNMNQPFAWTEMICPSTGQTYRIDTSADFESAFESIKFHRPEVIGQEIEYNFTIFNN